MCFNARVIRGRSGGWREGGREGGRKRGREEEREEGKRGRRGRGREGGEEREEGKRGRGEVREGLSVTAEADNGTSSPDHTLPSRATYRQYLRRG